MMTNTNDMSSKTQTQTPSKRKLDNSLNDENTNKKTAFAFNYDKEKHTFQPADNHKGNYKKDNINGIYKVNVKKWNGFSINRIGFGKTLNRMNVKNINACKMVSKNIISVHFTKREEANKFIDNSELRTLGYDATIPDFYRTVVGVIKNVPVEITAKEIYDEIKQEHEIVKIERMTRRMPNGHRGYAYNMKIHFAGDTLPPHVTIYHGIEKVQPFIPPVLQCTGCLRYGHHVKACKASAGALACSRCGSTDHERKKCVKPHPVCIHCKHQHEATARECPERVRQNNIRILMTSEKLSFKEVIEQFPQFTSKNEFELLENIHEFPPLQRNSYKNQLLGKKQKLVHRPQRKKLIFTPNQPEKFSRHYTEQTTSTEPTAPMSFNQNKVTEIEREITQTNQAVNYANNESMGGFSHDDSSSSEMSVSVESTQLEEIVSQTENTPLTKS